MERGIRGKQALEVFCLRSNTRGAMQIAVVEQSWRGIHVEAEP